MDLVLDSIHFINKRKIYYTWEKNLKNVGKTMRSYYKMCSAFTCLEAGSNTFVHVFDKLVALGSYVNLLAPLAQLLQTLWYTTEKWFFFKLGYTFLALYTRLGYPSFVICIKMHWSFPHLCLVQQDPDQFGGLNRVFLFTIPIDGCIIDGNKDFRTLALSM